MRYLVMRRTMTGSYEDCVLDPNGEAVILADSPEEAQELVGDGLGVYRVIELGPPNEPDPVTHVVVEHTISRSTTATPPPLDPEDPDVAAARRLEASRGAQQTPRVPRLADIPS